MSEKKNIEFLSIRLKPGEWKVLCEALKEDGYAETPQGAHDFLFDMVSGEDAVDDEEKPEPEAEEKNPAIDALFEYLKKNPDALLSAASLGKSVFTSLLKKKMGL